MASDKESTTKEETMKDGQHYTVTLFTKDFLALRIPVRDLGNFKKGAKVYYAWIRGRLHVAALPPRRGAHVIHVTGKKRPYIYVNVRDVLKHHDRVQHVRAASTKGTLVFKKARA